MYFIQPHILERLQSGAFVPQRKPKAAELYLSRAAAPLSVDRRQAVSPLAITKRCIPYEPRVFANRKEDLLALAALLNHPETRLLKLQGPQGQGKTSVLRALAEMMGGGDEQLFWLDLHPLMAPEHLLETLLQSIHVTAQALLGRALKEAWPPGQTPEPASAASVEAEKQPSLFTLLEQLEGVLTALPHWPLLIVMDNVEALLGPSQRGQQDEALQALEDSLGLLLSFPNVRVVLSGETLPLHPPLASDTALCTYSLAPLSAETLLPLLQVKETAPPPVTEAPSEAFGATRSVLSPALVQTLFEVSEGQPWLLKTWLYLGLKTTVNLEALASALQEAPPAHALSRFLYPRLQADEQPLIQLLALMQHPMDWQSLEALGEAFFVNQPPPLPEHLTSQGAQPNLKRPSLMRSLLRSQLPPQQLLQQLQSQGGGLSRSGSATQAKPPSALKLQPQLSLYQALRQAFQELIPVAQRQRLHTQLSRFYQALAQQPQALQAKQLDAARVLAEAQYHNERARSLAWMLSQPVVDRPSAPASAEVKLKPWEQEKLGAQQPSSEHLSSDHSALKPFTLSRAESAVLEAEALQTWWQEEEAASPFKPVSRAFTPLEGPHLDRPRGASPSLNKALVEAEAEALLHLLEGPPVASPTLQPVVAPAPPQELPNPLQPARSSIDPEEQPYHAAIRAQFAHPERLALALLNLADFRFKQGRLSAAMACLTLQHPWQQLKQQAYWQAQLQWRQAYSAYYAASGLGEKETSKMEAALHQAALAVDTLSGLLVVPGAAEEAPQPAPSSTGLPSAVSLTQAAEQLGAWAQQLGQWWATHQRWPKASQAWQLALRLASAAPLLTPNPSALAELNTLLAEAAEAQSQWGAAQHYYQQAYQADEAQANWAGAASSVYNLARVAWQQAHWSLALSSLQQAICLDEQAGYLEGQWYGLKRLAQWQQHLAQLPEAAPSLVSWVEVQQTLQRALQLAQQAESPLWQAQTYFQWAEACCQQAKSWVASSGGKQPRLPTSEQQALYQQALNAYRQALHVGQGILSAASLERLQAAMAELETQVASN